MRSWLINMVQIAVIMIIGVTIGCISRQNCSCC